MQERCPDGTRRQRVNTANLIRDNAWWSFDLSSTVRLARIEGWQAVPGLGAPLFVPRLGATVEHAWSLDVRRLEVQRAAVAQAGD